MSAPHEVDRLSKLDSDVTFSILHMACQIGLKRIFQLADRNGNGFVEMGELREYLGEELGIGVEASTRFFNHTDANHDGHLSEREFLDMFPPVVLQELAHKSWGLGASHHPPPPPLKSSLKSVPSPSAAAGAPAPSPPRSPRNEVGPGEAEYQVIVYTGDLPNAGTEASVFLQMFGKENQTGIIQMGNSGAFQPRKVVEFRLVTKVMGNLMKIRIGHDESGRNCGWLLEKVHVIRSDTRELWAFPCGQWLDPQKGDMASTRTLFPDEGAAAAAAHAMSQIHLGAGALEGLDNISGGNNLNAFARTAQSRGHPPRTPAGGVGGVRPVTPPGGWGPDGFTDIHKYGTYVGPPPGMSGGIANTNESHLRGGGVVAYDGPIHGDSRYQASGPSDIRKYGHWVGVNDTGHGAIGNTNESHLVGGGAVVGYD